MPLSLSYLFKRSYEFISADDLGKIPVGARGLYVLYKAGPKKEMNVVYVGMVTGDRAGIRGRIQTHKRVKKDLWSHCSVYEAWDNITHEEVQELEGLFRHIYRLDEKANQLNKQRAHLPLVNLAIATSLTEIAATAPTSRKKGHTTNEVSQGLRDKKRLPRA